MNGWAFLAGSHGLCLVVWSGGNTLVILLDLIWLGGGWSGPRLGGEGGERWES